MFKKVLLLSVSVGLAIIAVFIQQFFISDSPVKTSVEINGNSYTFGLPVVYEGDEECLIEMAIPDTSINGTLNYKIASSNDSWKNNPLIRMNDNLVNVVPRQKPNIKIEYYITLFYNGKSFDLPSDHVILRFQKTVPKPIFYPYVLTLFLALIFACYTGSLAIYNINRYKKYAQITFYLLTGCIILGLVVHLMSFRHLFLQFSPNNDLTFYKNLIIFLAWLGIYQLHKRKEYRYLTIAAAVLTLILFILPQHVVFSYLY